jgi:outer membrane receptor protein involved in Fe transport
MKTVGKIKVNTGIKGVARIGESEFNDENLANAAQPDLPDSDHFRNNLYLLFGYNSYQLSVKSWNLNAGYRLEYAKSESFFGGQADELSLHYFNIMPDVSVRYKFNDSESLGLSFNQALQRPNISYLNPFISRLNPSLVISGNPDLKPVKTNKFNLQYSRFRKSALTASIYYSFVNNDIQQVLSNTDTIGVSKLTYANVGKKSNLGFSMSYSVGLSKTVNMNFSGNLTYLRINGMVEGKAVINKGFMTDLNAGLNYSLAKTWILDGRFSYTSPVIYLQGKTSSYPYYVFSASKTFLGNKLSASLSIVNPFKKFQDVQSTYMDQHVHQTSTVQTYYRTILIRAGYRFGQLKSKIQTNRKSISNDDAISQKH